MEEQQDKKNSLESEFLGLNRGHCSLPPSLSPALSLPLSLSLSPSPSLHVSSAPCFLEQEMLQVAQLRQSEVGHEPICCTGLKFWGSRC